MLILDFGIDGKTGKEKLAQLKQLSNEGIAILLEKINQDLQGSGDSQMSEKMVHIGDKETIPIESRYDVFTSTIDEIKSTPYGVNSDRITDTLALSVLLLQPVQRW